MTSCLIKLQDFNDLLNASKGVSFMIIPLYVAVDDIKNVNKR